MRRGSGRPQGVRKPTRIHVRDNWQRSLQERAKPGIRRVCLQLGQSIEGCGQAHAIELELLHCFIHGCRRPGRHEALTDAALRLGEAMLMDEAGPQGSISSYKGGARIPCWTRFGQRKGGTTTAMQSGAPSDPSSWLHETTAHFCHGSA